MARTAEPPAHGRRANDAREPRQSVKPKEACARPRWRLRSALSLAQEGGAVSACSGAAAQLKIGIAT
jgi:hypothetical protein